MLLTTAGLPVPGPAHAVSPKVQGAIKSLEKIEADGPKFQSFCKLLRDNRRRPRAGGGERPRR
jgi:hypothetical protein